MLAVVIEAVFYICILRIKQSTYSQYVPHECLCGQEKKGEKKERGHRERERRKKGRERENWILHLSAHESSHCEIGRHAPASQLVGRINGVHRM